MKKLLAQLAVASALAITAATAVTVGHAAAEDSDVGLASITLVHGVPDLLVDVYVNGGPPIEDISFTTVATVPGEKGKNTVAIRAANAPANSAALLTRSFYLRKNQSKTVVAHLSSSGSPKLTVYANDQSPLTAGTARLTVRHTVEAPAVDVVVNNPPPSLRTSRTPTKPRPTSPPTPTSWTCGPPAPRPLSWTTCR